MININGMSYSGSNISIVNGKIIVNGEDLTPDSKEISINVEGDIDFLNVDHCKTISILGNVKIIKSGSGNISCDSIHEGASTGSGDIDVNNITGNVKTGSGNVLATIITGDVSTGSGNIKFKK